MRGGLSDGCDACRGSLSLQACSMGLSAVLLALLLAPSAVVSVCSASQPGELARLLLWACGSPGNLWTCACAARPAFALINTL